MGADNTFGETNFNPDMMTPPDKLREIAERDLNKRIVGILMAHGVNSIDAFNSTPDLTAVISEHYYPKEFVEWKDVNCIYLRGGNLYVINGCPKTIYGDYVPYTLNELFNYWKENEQ